MIMYFVSKPEDEFDCVVLELGFTRPKVTSELFSFVIMSFVSLKFYISVTELSILLELVELVAFVELVPLSPEDMFDKLLVTTGLGLVIVPSP